MGCIGQNIKKIMDEKKISVEDAVKHLFRNGVVAKKSGEPYKASSLYNFFNCNRELDSSLLPHFGTLLNVPEGAFFEYDHKSVIKIPIIGEASCGLPIINNNQENGKFCNYNGEHYNHNLYCVIACGDSMSPEIEDGDEVICDPTITIQHGDLVHYTINNESAIKLYIEDKEANIIQFVPYNSNDIFKTKTLRLDEEEDVRIAKVVSVNKLKINNRSARLKLIGRL